MPKWLYWCLLAGFLYGTFEGSSSLALLALEQIRKIEYAPTRIASVSEKHRRLIGRMLNGESGYYAFSPELGWTIRGNGRWGPYRSNAQGFRAERSYDPIPPRGVVRIAALGDSYTHDSGVAYEDAWTTRLKALVPALEVLNFGVGGYGLDQAFLRYRRDAAKFHPHIVLMGFMSENIRRSVNVFRPFYRPATGIPMAKPRYAVRDGELVLIRNPIQSLSGYRELVADPRRLLSALAVHDRYRDSGYSRWAIDILPSVRLARTLGFKYAAYVARRDRHVRDYDTGSEPFQVTARIFDAFVEAVLKQGALPIILLFPHRRDIARYREDGSRAYAPMTRYLRAKGYNVVDLMGAFHRPGETRGLDELAGGHYRPLGTALVARHIADYLRKRALTTVAAVEAGAAAMARRLGGSGGPTRPRHGGSEPDSDRGTRPAHR